MNEFTRLITLQDANTRVVLTGTMLLGIAAGLVGSFAVLRRRSLVGDAVAHAALPGICTAYLIVGDRNFGAFMLGALVFGVLAAAFIAFVKNNSRIKEDAAIALVIGGFFGLGIVMSRSIQNLPSGNRSGLDTFIFGKAASMVRSDAWMIVWVAVFVCLVIATLYKEFKVLCFDRDFATTQGWPSGLLDLLLMSLVCVCTVVGLPSVGVVLMVSLLVIPAIAARFWTNKLGTMTVLSAAIGGISGFAGTALSAVAPAPASGLSRGWPTGPLITLVAASAFVLSLLFAPKRGVIADLWRRRSLRRRVALQNLLRAVYERLEPGGDFSRPWQLEELSISRSSSLASIAVELREASRLGYVQPSGREGFILTSTGSRAATQVVRAHRLWELFLVEQADIAPDHVDRDADQIEHILSTELIERLEVKLRETGRFPTGQVQSPHPIELPGREP